MDSKIVDRLLSMEHLEKFGQLTDVKTRNAGLGFLYYALGRIYRPRTAIVIGSYRGFSVVSLAQAMKENGWGKLHFVDPSFSDDFWKDAGTVERYFESMDLEGVVRHHKFVSEDFIPDWTSGGYTRDNEIGMLLIDGRHTYSQVKFEHEALLPYLRGPALFHDSMSTGVSTMSGAPYPKSVFGYINELRMSDRFDVWEIPIGPGLAIVQERG